MKSQKKVVKADREQISSDAPPLSFANSNIQNLSDLKQLQPRSGKRKPFDGHLIEEIKEDKKKQQIQDATQQAINQQGINQDENINKEGEQEMQERQKEREEEEKIKERRGIPAVTRSIQPPQGLIGLQQSQLMQSKGGYIKQLDDTMNKNQNKSLQIKLVQTSIVLSYNKISSLNNFYQIVDIVMPDCINLQWIDLSHNFIEKLDYNFADFPNLKSLYLHANYIRDIKDLNQLNVLQKFNSLTIHGNPIDQVPNFRLYIIGMIPYIKKLDSVLVTKKELDNSLVWKTKFNLTNPPLPKIYAKPDYDIQY